jgi:hypothetical protein
MSLSQYRFAPAEPHRALADLRAYYNEILCLTILKCEAAAATRNLLSDGSLRTLFNAFDERTGRSRPRHDTRG